MSAQQFRRWPGPARFVRAVGQMSWTFRKEYLVVVLLALAAEIGLRVLPLDRLALLYRVRYAEAPNEGPSDPIDALPLWARRRLAVVGVVMRHWPVDGTCLRQSLVAGHRIRRLEPRLKLGVTRSDGAVQAHAWLEVTGRSLDETSVLYDELPAIAR